MAKVNVNGIDVYYESYGNGPAILGIHGTPSSAVLWQDAARELGDRGRCIIYDRRGFSRSERPEPFDSVDLNDHVEDAAALLEALSATPAVVIGRSTGGQIALALAHRYPQMVQALALLEPAVFTIDTEATAWANRLRLKVLQAAEQDGDLAEVVFRDALGDQAWESLPDEVKDVFSAAGPAVLAEIRGRGLDLSAQAHDFSGDDLASIAQPTLLISAEDSPQVLRSVNDRLAAALPNVEKVLVPGGHLINPAHSSVLDFLDRNLEPHR